jgi:hypothetical protein
MGRRVWGRVCEAGSLAPGQKQVYQPFRCNDDVILLGVRQWFVFIGDPVFTGLTASIYANDSVTGLPSTLIAASTKSWEKSDFLTLDHGHYELYFDFPRVNLQTNTTYHLVTNAATYSPAGGSHISNMLAYPRPVYSEGLTISAVKLLTFPFACYFIGAKF